MSKHQSKTKEKTEASEPEKPKTIAQEFREFVVRGNVIELAVGLTVGASFTTVVKSLVSNIILPPIGLILQGSSFNQLYIPLTGETYANLEAAEAAGAPLLKYGQFISDIIDFLLIAIAVFVLVRVATKVNAQFEKEVKKVVVKKK